MLLPAVIKGASRAGVSFFFGQERGVIRAVGNECAFVYSTCRDSASRVTEMIDEGEIEWCVGAPGIRRNNRVMKGQVGDEASNLSR